MHSAKKSFAMAHKTWLVGVGAYDSGREKAVDKMDRLFVGGSQLFNDLLEKGESVEVQIQANLEVKRMLKDKISALKAKFGFSNENRDQKIDMLTQRVDNLIDVVAKLAQQKAAEQKTTTSATKKAAAKPATNAATKATTRKAAPKASAKPATKATTAKAATKTVAKPAAKARATKAPAKASATKAPTKTAAKATTTKAPTKAAAKPTAKATPVEPSTKEANAEMKD
ncbi:MAG: hypothetical protein ABJK37_05140 [Paraglaciecola sp.]|uniref:hypothetical protein n=1 Tax=Paraglaciecola sp. TaxID=1920173 RepID=UPI003297061F